MKKKKKKFTVEIWLCLLSTVLSGYKRIRLLILSFDQLSQTNLFVNISTRPLHTTTSRDLREKKEVPLLLLQFSILQPFSLFIEENKRVG